MAALRGRREGDRETGSGRERMRREVNRGYLRKKKIESKILTNLKLMLQ